MRISKLIALPFVGALMAGGLHAQLQPVRPRPVILKPVLATPVLFMTSMERYSVNGQKLIRFNYIVTNKADYAAALFAPAPDLPPCGANATSSRTWVDFYNARSDARIYGFCALGTSADLGKLWFALPEGTAPPTRVVIKLTDRKTGAVARSNAEVTVLTPPPSG